MKLFHLLKHVLGFEPFQPVVKIANDNLSNVSQHETSNCDRYGHLINQGLSSSTVKSDFLLGSVSDDNLENVRQYETLNCDRYGHATSQDQSSDCIETSSIGGRLPDEKSAHVNQCETLQLDPYGHAVEIGRAHV